MNFPKFTRGPQALCSLPQLLPPVTNDWGCSRLHPWLLTAPKSHSLITEYQQAPGEWSLEQHWTMSRHSSAGAGVRTPSHPLCVTNSLCWVCPVVVLTACPSPRGGTEGTQECWRKWFLHWISWDQGRGESRASPGARWADSAMLGLDRCLWKGKWVHKVYEGDCHVYFGNCLFLWYESRVR